MSEAYCKEGQKPVGPLSIEFRGVADSAAEQLMSNYKVQRGMPFTHVKDIDFSKVHMRYSESFC